MNYIQVTHCYMNIKVLSSGYKLTVLSGYEVLITLTVTIWLQLQMVFPNVIILSSNTIDYYYLATSSVLKCDHLYHNTLRSLYVCLFVCLLFPL